MSERAGQEETESWTTMPGGLQSNPDHIMKPPDTQAGQARTLGELETEPWVEESSVRIVRPLNRYIQQEALGDSSLSVDLPGETLCLPVAFFSLAEGMGYSDIYARDPLRFVESVHGQVRKDPERGWSRPAVSKAVRRIMKGMPVVSWQYGANNFESLTAENMAGMHTAGYLDTQEEEDYFRDHIVGPDPATGRDISDIVRDGTPVLVTVKAGFAANKDEHAVIIDGWDEKGVHIVDPDGRNTGDGSYTDEHVREYLTGACTVILPHEKPDLI